MTVRQAVVITVAALAGAGVGGVTRGAAQGSDWVKPRCDLKPGHYLVNSGVLYLQSATRTRYDDQRAKDLRDANRVLTQALTTGDQEKNPAAWYYLGRYYVMEKDPVGADTAFARAEALIAECRDDVAFWRRFLWVPVLNAGIAAWQAGNTDSAMASFRRANAIYAAEPNALIYLATLYANADRADSAAKYYELGIAAAGDAKFAKDKQDATFNLARVYHRAERWDQAAAAYRQYLAFVPGDAEATAGLAAVFTVAGNRDSALALYETVLARADSLSPLDLFAAGVGIFRGVPSLPDTAAAGASCRAEARNDRTLTARRIAARCDSVKKMMLRDYDAGAAKIYRVAARAFEAGLARNSHHRDALFNLANTYLVLEDTARLLPTAQRLYALDPLNRNTARLLAAGWQLRGKTDSTLYYLVLADSLLPVEVTVGSFAPEDAAAAVSGLVTNFHAKPSAPFTLTLEFLNATGEVVAQAVADVPQIAPEGSHAFQLHGAGKGIAAWRYRKG